MWKLVNGRLVHTTDDSRIEFRTNISKNILEQLKVMAAQNDTHINYLLENGLENVLSTGTIIFNKETRPKDRIQYKTTYNKDLLEAVKKFAKNHKLFINDVIEYSIDFIDMNTIKNTDYKNRVVRK
ncbi:rRNA methyltransferase [Lederbergia panacisoli]|uniref:rRNA methyltransferase n=1 Tax=Lederbergia panacisoli TaxID=1255251 RepID=UPI00214AA3BC|nr:rRNA methyltransferase [Lederbergia panacisoli]MCR2822864.1 rRNA methyltransferase [Lederbergia panacisoli]